MSNAAGRIIRRDAFGDMWRSAVAAARTCGKPPAEIPAGTRCRETCTDAAHMLPAGTRFHDLRHFYASALISANLNPKVIQARLGHATIAETMDLRAPVPRLRRPRPRRGGRHPCPGSSGTG